MCFRFTKMEMNSSDTKNSSSEVESDGDSSTSNGLAYNKKHFTPPPEEINSPDSEASTSQQSNNANQMHPDEILPSNSSNASILRQTIHNILNPLSFVAINGVLCAIRPVQPNDAVDAKLLPCAQPSRVQRPRFEPNVRKKEPPYDIPLEKIDFISPSRDQRLEHSNYCDDKYHHIANLAPFHHELRPVLKRKASYKPSLTYAREQNQREMASRLKDAGFVKRPHLLRFAHPNAEARRNAVLNNNDKPSTSSIFDIDPMPASSTARHRSGSDDSSDNDENSLPKYSSVKRKWRGSNKTQSKPKRRRIGQIQTKQSICQTKLVQKDGDQLTESDSFYQKEYTINLSESSTSSDSDDEIGHKKSVQSTENVRSDTKVLIDDELENLPNDREMDVLQIEQDLHDISDSMKLIVMGTANANDTAAVTMTENIGFNGNQPKDANDVLEYNTNPIKSAALTTTKTDASDSEHSSHSKMVIQSITNDLETSKIEETKILPIQVNVNQMKMVQSDAVRLAGAYIQANYSKSSSTSQSSDKTGKLTFAMQTNESHQSDPGSMINGDGINTLTTVELNNEPVNAIDLHKNIHSMDPVKTNFSSAAGVEFINQLNDAEDAKSFGRENNASKNDFQPIVLSDEGAAIKEMEVSVGENDVGSSFDMELIGKSAELSKFESESFWESLYGPQENDNETVQATMNRMMSADGHQEQKSDIDIKKEDVELVPVSVIDPSRNDSLDSAENFNILDYFN